jgi:hypothetical protein
MGEADSSDGVVSSAARMPEPKCFRQGRSRLIARTTRANEKDCRI